jgi:hypothetical protein
VVASCRHIQTSFPAFIRLELPSALADGYRAHPLTSFAQSPKKPRKYYFLPVTTFSRNSLDKKDINAPKVLHPETKCNKTAHLFRKLSSPRVFDADKS